MKLALWGMGEYGTNAIIELSEKKEEIIALGDCNSDKWG